MENIIPDEMPKFGPFELEGYKAQHEWQKRGMYGFVSWKWVNPFVKWIGNRRVLEVMSGVGYLAYALRYKGIPVIATDTRRWELHSHHPANKERFPDGGWKAVTSIERLSANKAIVQYGRNVDILIISWPYMDDSAYHAIKAMHVMNPNALVVYIGEGEGGCTASELFFEHFETVQDIEFEHVADQYETWHMLHDYMTLGRFKP